MTPAALFAVDPAGLGGVVLRGLPGPARDRWLAELRAALPEAAPWRRVPLHVTADRLLGAIDLAATLQSGRRVAQVGVLAQADGGVLVLASAERLGLGTAARIAAALDCREVVTERDGLALRSEARIGVIALHEGDADEPLPQAFGDRLALDVRPDT